MNKEDYCKFEDFLKEYQDLREIQDELRLVNNIEDEREERIDSIMNYVDDKLNSPDRRNIIEWLKNLLPDLQLVEEMFLGDCINDLDNNNTLGRIDDQEFYSHTNENSFFQSSESSLSEYSHENLLDDQFINFAEPLDKINENFCGMIKDEISKQLKDIQDHIGQKENRGKTPKERNESIPKYVNEEHNKNTIFLNILCRLQNSESRLELGIFKELQTWIYTIDEKTLNKIDEEKLHKLSKKKRAKDTIDEKKKKHIEELTKMENWYISLKTAPAVIKTQTLSICTFNIKKFSKNNKGVCIDKKKCKNNIINCRCGFDKRTNIIADNFKEEIKKHGLKTFDIIAIQEAQSDGNNQPIEAIEGLVNALNKVCKLDNTYHYEITSQSIFDLEYGVFIYNQKRLKCITISTGYPITETEMELKDKQLLETCFGGNDLTKNNIKEKLSESTNFRLPTYGLFQLKNSFKKILICSVHFKSNPSIEHELIDDLIPYSPQKLYEEKQIYSVLCGDFNFKNGNSTLKNKDFCSGLDLQNNSTNLAHYFAGEKKCYDNIYFLNIKNYKTKIQRELSDMNSKIIIEDDEQKEELNKAFIFALNRNFFTKVEEEQIGRIMELVKLKEGFDRRERKCQQDEYEIRIKIADTIFEDKERRNQILNEIVEKSSIAMTAKVNRFKEQLEKIGSLDLFTIASFLFSDHLPVGVILDI